MEQLINLNKGNEFNSFKHRPLLFDLGNEEVELKQHLLIAGSSGFGKSNAMNCIIGDFIMQFNHTELALIIIDPKRVGFTKFKDSSYLATKLIYETADILKVLQELKEIMKSRLDFMVDNNMEYIEQKNNEGYYSRIKKIVVVIDEYAELKFTESKTMSQEIQKLVILLVQQGRAAGIHFIIGTQRPEHNIINSAIKSNLINRICFSVSSERESKLILDRKEASNLKRVGDFIARINNNWYVGHYRLYNHDWTLKYWE